MSQDENASAAKAKQEKLSESLQGFFTDHRLACHALLKAECGKPLIYTNTLSFSICATCDKLEYQIQC